MSKYKITEEHVQTVLLGMAKILKKHRELKKISIYRVEQLSGLQGSQIKGIEAGRSLELKALIKYVYAVGLNIIFSADSPSPPSDN